MFNCLLNFCFCLLPEDIVFIHSEELEEKYPELPPRKREDAVCKDYGAVFIIGVGASLKSGHPHDDRAPDYDNWTTPTGRGPGLNGDIIVWNPEIKTAFELSSMEIRVDQQALWKNSWK